MCQARYWPIYNVTYIFGTPGVITSTQVTGSASTTLSGFVEPRQIYARIVGQPAAAPEPDAVEVAAPAALVQQVPATVKKEAAKIAPLPKRPVVQRKAVELRAFSYAKRPLPRRSHKRL